MEEGNPKEFKLKGVKILQKISWLFMRPAFKLFIGLKIDCRCDVNKLKRPLIIVSNHSSYLDPPLLGVVLPFNSDVLPVYFMTRDKILDRPFWGSFLSAIGAFRAHKGEGVEKALVVPKQILAAGRSVTIFPQGHFFQDFKAEQGRVGAAVLALETNVPILPVGISGLKNVSWLKLFSFRHHAKVLVGQPFLLKDKIPPALQTDIDLATKVIMGEIGKLLAQN